MAQVAAAAGQGGDQAFCRPDRPDGNPVDEAFGERRRDCPDRRPETGGPHLIIEAFPFGRRQMRFELLPLLEAVGP